MVSTDDHHFEKSRHLGEGNKVARNLSSNVYSEKLVCDEPYGQGRSVTWRGAVIIIIIIIIIIMIMIICR
jgi:hypothetical protein